MGVYHIFTSRQAIVLALIATVVLSFICYQSIVKLSSLASWVDHTHVVQLNLQKTYSSLSDADSQLKSFLITRDSSYYRKLLREERQIGRAIKLLDSLTLDNEFQHKRITALDSLVRARWTYMLAIVNGDPVQYDLLAARIDECNVRLEQLIAGLNAKEDELLQARRHHSSRYQATAPFTLFAFQILIALCLLVSFYQVTADLKTKERLRNDALQTSHELTSQRDFTQRIFENTVDVMIIFDAKLNIVAMNKRARELYDKDGQAIGKNVLDLYPQARGSSVIEGIIRAFEGNNVHHPATESIVLPGVYYESFFVPLRSDENIIRVMAIHHDVSELVKMTSDVRAMNQQLQKTNEELEQFAYVTSHDLQEPLRKIRTFADFARREIVNTESVMRNLNKIVGAAERMSVLIRDILNYSKLSNSEVVNEIVDLNVVMGDVLHDFELMIEEKAAVIESTTLPKVLGSQQQLNQVFANLISNALKFCVTAPCVRIGCRHEEGMYYITISDNGVGFEQAYAEQIFDVFQRLHHRHEFSGTGIGLALCKRIIEKHGGSILATSTPNQGTTFTICLPDLLNDRKNQVSVKVDDKA